MIFPLVIMCLLGPAENTYTSVAVMIVNIGRSNIRIAVLTYLYSYLLNLYIIATANGLVTAISASNSQTFKLGIKI